MFPTQRSLTDEERAELNKLNAAVHRALEARRKWLDAKMVETSRLQVGDDIYDIGRGVKLGTVTRLYRVWRNREGGVRDNSHYCDYEYTTGALTRDNTSRQPELRFGTQDDAISEASRRLEALKRL